ncbi:hypothetical protein [Thermoflavimicrobium daqui]|nr:hypothetical protein [Thermoflavimicrobium daqui]
MEKMIIIADFFDVSIDFLLGRMDAPKCHQRDGEKGEKKKENS